MSDHALNAVIRTEFGKGAARRTRRAGLVPAVLYGHGSQPVHLALPSHEVFLALKGKANALLTLSIGETTELALAKDIQREPVRGTLEHLDLILVRKGEKVSVEVPIVVVGESVSGTIHTLELQSVKVQADATAIPERIEISIEGLADGAIVRAGDLTLPKGTVLEEDEEILVVNVSTPRASEADLEADAASAAAGAASGVDAEAAGI